MTLDEVHARLTTGARPLFGVCELWAPSSDDAVRINVSRKAHGAADLHLSVLGNPYFRTASMQRGETIALYRRWLAQQVIGGESPQLAALDEIVELLYTGRHVELACWCKQPGPCHAHIIAKAVSWRIFTTDRLPSSIVC